MLTGFPNAANAISKSSMLSITNGCILEYNMNDLIHDAKIEAPAEVITATLTAPASQGGYTYKPFEKLFPITSIIDPRRPKIAGVQYMILGDPSVPSTINSGIWSANKYGSSAEFAKDSTTPVQKPHISIGLPQKHLVHLYLTAYLLLHTQQAKPLLQIK